METPFKGKKGLGRLLNASRYSIDGLVAAYQHENAFRQEIYLSLSLVPVAIYFGQTSIDRALMIACVFLVLIVELINSSIEAVVDRISLDHHLLAKRAKDIASAAVFVSLINLVVVWGIIIF
jgi:diacylglycerol kinase (ATP)